jgi:hypothetical protein
MSKENEKAESNHPAAESEPQVCFGNDCMRIIWRRGQIVDVVVSKSCPVNLREKAKEAGKELLEGRAKMRYTIEE